MIGTKDLLNPEWEPLEAARYIRDVRVSAIRPDSVTGHYAAGGFLPADVEMINAEVGQFLDVVTQRGGRLKCGGFLMNPIVEVEEERAQIDAIAAEIMPRFRSP